MKEKEKKAKVAANDLKKLVDKLAELENQMKKSDINQFKGTSTQLNEKKKELKCVKDDLEKANKRAGDYQDIINQKNGRICELETTNTRLQLMFDHYKEVKGTPKDEKKVEQSEPQFNKKELKQ